MRDGCDITTNLCTINDLVKCLPHTIGSLLGLVPEKYRDDIIEKAINEDMTEDGTIYNRLTEEDEEDD